MHAPVDLVFPLVCKAAVLLRGLSRRSCRFLKNEEASRLHPPLSVARQPDLPFLGHASFAHLRTGAGTHSQGEGHSRVGLMLS